MSLLYPEELEIIRAIHANDWKLILTMSGGGTRLLPALLEYGGGSNTLLKFYCPYSVQATRELLGLTSGVETPRLVTIQTASKLAHAAMDQWTARRAVPERIVSVACTASLVKAGRERPGRIHRVCTAYFAIDGTQQHEAVVEYLLPHTTREEQEVLTAIHTLRTIEDAMSLTAEVPQL